MLQAAHLFVQDIYSSKSLEELDSGESRTRPAKSMPDLSGSERPRSQPQRHNSADLLAPGGGPDILDFGASSPVGGKPSQPPQFITVEIVKGTSGFGFTIADSAYGQKVGGRSFGTLSVTVADEASVAERGFGHPASGFLPRVLETGLSKDKRTFFEPSLNAHVALMF